MTGDSPGVNDVAELLGERLQRYVDLWSSASDKLSAGTITPTTSSTTGSAGSAWSPGTPPQPPP